MIRGEHPEIAFGKTGILLVNLGTPDSTKWWDVRKYLKEFLSDRRHIKKYGSREQMNLHYFITQEVNPTDYQKK